METISVKKGRISAESNKNSTLMLFFRHYSWYLLVVYMEKMGYQLFLKQENLYKYDFNDTVLSINICGEYHRNWPKPVKRIHVHVIDVSFIFSVPVAIQYVHPTCIEMFHQIGHYRLWQFQESGGGWGHMPPVRGKKLRNVSPLQRHVCSINTDKE